VCPARRRRNSPTLAHPTYRRSGLLGLSGLSDDTRDLVAAADASDGAARLALAR